MVLIRAISNTTRINEETAMGIILVSFFAFGIALLSYIQQRPERLSSRLRQVHLWAGGGNGAP
jgi:ABC-type Mn2+/Zn2+ transport system permease subunit